MAADEFEIIMEIVCENLPGLLYEGRSPLHLGIQDDDKIIDTAPADRKRITFKPTLRVRKHSDGSANWLGPFAHGPRTERFIYLNWVVVQDGKQLEQIGRIKLHLNHIEYRTVQKAAASEKPIKVTLQLTSEKGKPVFASVREHQAAWQV